ncbi:prostaglandin reductase 1-like [Schistocerca piceifrons]|uniref:prostaglandin reductase 1-like n=1 Tax=Schistocerca piceifrons TaxID=274613 RepID=UPI001F5EAD28|nr:prostaglandin reductase 1-like [Schistocerca piceifrons]
MAGARKLVIARPFGAEPLPEDFCLQEERELPPLRDGQILVEALYISLDPFEWAFKHLHKVGATMIGSQVRWLTEELGFEHAFNYQTSDVGAALRRVAPGGVDVYYDTVGGDLSSAVADCMRERGRIAVCGCVSTYRDPRPPKMLLIPPAVVRKRLRMDGFMFTQWRDRWPEADERMALWIRQGRLKWRETITDGFLNTPRAFAAMLRGDAIGKALVKV